MIVSALSEAKRGEPITCSSHYLELPIGNKPLHEWLGTVSVVTDKDIDLQKIELQQELLEKEVLLPGDIIPLESISKPGFYVHKNGSEEQEALERYLEKKGLAIKPTPIQAIRVNYAWEVLNANQELASRLKESVAPSATIEPNVQIKGTVIIGRNVIIRSGSYIEGPAVIGDNCEIGPMAHIRPYTSIGHNCIIGKTEIIDCVILPGTVSKHHAYLGHSVLGKNVNVGAFSVTGDYRHDSKEHTTVLHGKKIATGRRKLGAFIGNNVRIAIGTLIYPGRKLWPETSTLPNEVVQKDRCS